MLACLESHVEGPVGRRHVRLRLLLIALAQDLRSTLATLRLPLLLSSPRVGCCK